LSSDTAGPISLSGDVVTVTRKKLIEVALPLEAINKAAAREKSIRHGHPSTLHLWWARRPLAAARAVIFAQMVDDPSACPELFSTEKAQEKERRRLFRLIEELVQWENTTNEKVLAEAREEIWQSWRRACADNVGHPRAKELFDRHKLPAFHDPFAGGGSLPLEAQRLGLQAHASDLNPVAVLITKAMIEIPPRFAGCPPANPEARKDPALFEREWRGAQGLAEDVRYYGKWMRDEADKRIGHLYPKIEVTAEMTKGRHDLKPYVGRKLTVIAWLWARTVKSPNPAFRKVDVPLASTFMLSTKPGMEAYVEPIVEDGAYRFTVKAGKPKNAEAAKNGTKLARGANFRCVMSGAPIEGDYIKAEGKAGRMSSRLMAIVAEGERGRVYLAVTPEQEAAARKAKPTWKPDGEVPARLTGGTCVPYGLEQWGDLFTPRQLAALETFSDLAHEAQEQVKRDALAIGLPDDGKPLRDGGTGATAYADATAVYLAFAADKAAEGSTTLCVWSSLPSKLHVVSTFGRQALPMTWDYAESNVFADSSGNILRMSELAASVVERQCSGSVIPGESRQADAAQLLLPRPRVVSTDPPYYDNIGYADLSDFFYVWLRRSLRPVFPDLFSTLAVPKAQELVATPYRHGSREKAEAFFLGGMTQAMHRLAEQTNPAFPVTIYYAFKQAESDGANGTASTGWDTFLEAVIRAGFGISGTWPIRTERAGGFRNKDQNALASSIILVCRPRGAEAPTATRREFVTALKVELPKGLKHLQRSNIAPVDLAQAAIGPGMAVYTRYATVLDAEGKPVSVRDALALINQTLDEALAEQEGDFDTDTRWALAWFEGHGFGDGPYGVAETLSKAKNTSVSGLERAGILRQKGGKVRLLKPGEFPKDWDPATDPRLSVWEMVQHLIRVLESGGESGAADVAKKLGSKADIARELAYRLFTISERKKRAQEALAYNGLVQSWPEIVRLVQEGGKAKAKQAQLFEDEE
jgi:putative DNA methylase